LQPLNILDILVTCDVLKNCERLTSLDISNFKTSNVRYMNYMFANCDKISTLDLNNFDTSVNLETFNFVKE